MNETSGGPWCFICTRHIWCIHNDPNLKAERERELNELVERYRREVQQLQERTKKARADEKLHWEAFQKAYQDQQEARMMAHQLQERPQKAKAAPARKWQIPEHTRRPLPELEKLIPPVIAHHRPKRPQKVIAHHQPNFVLPQLEWGKQLMLLFMARESREQRAMLRRADSVCAHIIREICPEPEFSRLEFISHYHSFSHKPRIFEEDQ